MQDINQRTRGDEDVVQQVCFIVPVLNEEAHIDRCIRDLYAQTGCRIVEVIVADGGSSDRTVPIVRGLKPRYPSLRLIHNPRRSQAAAINTALTVADQHAGLFVRFDAHSRYASDYASICLNALFENKATSVVVSMRTVGAGRFQRAVAAASNSWLGNGGSAHRSAGQLSRFVNHGHHAAFDRTFFVRAGGYDEDMSPNEDFEYDTRSLRLGGKIWLAAEAYLEYSPRSTARALARQYFGYGQARAKSHIKHRLLPGFRQLVPSLLFGLVLSACLLAPVRWEPALLAFGYALVCVAYGMFIAVRCRDPWLMLSGIAAIIMHLSYGAGVFDTLLDRARKWLTPRLRSRVLQIRRSGTA